MREFRYLFSDVAGTLLWKPELHPTIQMVLHQHSVDIDVSEVRFRHKIVSEAFTFPDRTSPHFYTEFNRALLFSLGVVPSTRLLEDLYRECASLPWAAYEDISYLRTVDLPVGVIANWDLTLQSCLHQHVDMAFFRVVGSAEAGVRKPDVRIYELALEGLGCDPAEVLYIGDSPKLDVEPAARVGMTTVLLDRLGIYRAHRGRRAGSLAEAALIVAET